MRCVWFQTLGEKGTYNKRYFADQFSGTHLLCDPPREQVLNSASDFAIYQCCFVLGPFGQRWTGDLSLHAMMPVKSKHECTHLPAIGAPWSLWFVVRFFSFSHALGDSAAHPSAAAQRSTATNTCKPLAVSRLAARRQTPVSPPPRAGTRRLPSQGTHGSIEASAGPHISHPDNPSSNGVSATDEVLHYTPACRAAARRQHNGCS